MNPVTNHIPSLPLEELLQRLEVAGFSFSPADRLRALRVLSGPGRDQLHDPARLKYLLAPVLTRGAAEQERFYGIFDRYFADITTAAPLPPPPYRGRWWHYLLAILLLALIGWGVYKAGHTKVPPLIVSIDGPDYGKVGEEITFIHTGPLPADSSNYGLRWELRDATTQQVEATNSADRIWTIKLPPPLDSSYRKQVSLRITDTGGGGVTEAMHPFSILCQLAPNLKKITGIPPTPIAVNTAIALSPEKVEDPWMYEWDFGDGQTANGPTQTHQYAAEGKYQVRLTVTDTTQAGFCAVTLQDEVNVGLVLAFAGTLPLIRDKPTPAAAFGWGFWVLLGMLGVLTIYYWLRWAIQRKPPAPAAPAGSREARFKVNDKAPYFIPFQAQESLLAVGPEQLRLAEAMRKRQTGFRRGIDVPRTLTATISQGGYPAVRFAYNTQPTEYLILIDEQTELSHLGRLFRHVAELMRGQDVYTEIYHFRRHFDRFWNSYTPEGISLELLYRRHPSHRLLLLADAHDLIDPHAAGKPALRSAYANALAQWKDRLLLTPVPPVSWSYREKIVQRLCMLYPADLIGLADAALYLEMDGDPPGEDFASWQATQVARREDADTEYRAWKRLRDHESYLRAYPGLWEWFLALSVFPTPTWEITIAIGHALERKGVVLNHDNLLRLARIPALQQGRFPNRLRQEMARELPPDIAVPARRAVRAELAAVRTETQNGHAGLQLETELAIQDFALQPESAEEQTTIRYLLKNGMLTPTQVAELDEVAQRASETATSQDFMQSNIATVTPRVDIRTYLGDDAPEPPPARQWANWFGPRFWKAVGTSLGFLVLLLLAWYLNGSNTLYQTLYGDQPRDTAANEQVEMRSNLWAKEVVAIDSAVIYNNYGVDLSAAAPNRLIIEPFVRAQQARFMNYGLAQHN